MDAEYSEILECVVIWHGKQGNIEENVYANGKIGYACSQLLPGARGYSYLGEFALVSEAFDYFMVNLPIEGK